MSPLFPTAPASTNGWKFWMTCEFILAAALLSFAMVFLVRAQQSRTPVVPLDIQNKILVTQKDQIAQSARMQLIQQAANETNTALQKDAMTIAELKDEAFKAAKVDPTKWAINIDVDPKVFVEKEKEKPRASGPAAGPAGGDSKKK